MNFCKAPIVAETTEASHVGARGEISVFGQRSLPESFNGSKRKGSQLCQ